MFVLIADIALLSFIINQGLMYIVVLILQELLQKDLQYHYLKRPYVLEGRTATEVPTPKYLDKDGKPIKGVKRHPDVEDGVIIYAGETEGRIDGLLRDIAGDRGRIRREAPSRGRPV